MLAAFAFGRSEILFTKPETGVKVAGNRLFCDLLPGDVNTEGLEGMSKDRQSTFSFPASVPGKSGRRLSSCGLAAWDIILVQTSSISIVVASAPGNLLFSHLL